MCKPWSYDTHIALDLVTNRNVLLCHAGTAMELFRWIRRHLLVFDVDMLAFLARIVVNISIKLNYELTE